MKIRALLAVAALAITSLHAQQESAPKPAAKPEGAKQTSSASAYRFEYTLTELSGKQKVNARKFEILASDRGSVMANSKVAVPLTVGPPGGNMQFNYVDLGLNANMHFITAGDGLIHLDVDVNMTFLVPTEPSVSTGINAPITRTVRMQIATEVKPGVPTSIGTVEDVASTHAYELSVTAMPR
jgi:hypothetical protein